MDFKLIFTANAGFLLFFENFTVSVDAFHNERAFPFSTLPQGLIRQMAQEGFFRNLRAMFFSHLHQDHFTTDSANEVLQYVPGANVLAPETVSPNQILLCGPSMHLHTPYFQMDFTRMLHDGPEYRNVPLYGLSLTVDNRRILIPGDSTDSASMARLVGTQPVDTAILNFPWITHPQNRKYVDEVLRPNHLILTHLPYPADDVDGYIPAAERSAAQLKHIPDVRFLTTPLQSEIL